MKHGVLRLPMWWEREILEWDQSPCVAFVDVHFCLDIVVDGDSAMVRLDPTGEVWEVDNKITRLPPFRLVICQEFGTSSASEYVGVYTWLRDIPSDSKTLVIIIGRKAYRLDVTSIKATYRGLGSGTRNDVRKHV